MRHAAISVHTLGTTPHAVIVAFGLCVFDAKGDIRQQLIIVDIEEQPGRVIEPRSVRWWMEQSDDARKVFEDEGVPLHKAVNILQCALTSIDGILLIRKDELDIISTVITSFNKDVVDIDELLDASSIGRSSIVVYPKFYCAAFTAAADAATLRAFWRAQESIRTEDAA